MHQVHIVVILAIFSNSVSAFYFYDSHYAQHREDYSYPIYPQNEEYSSPNEKTIDIEAEQVPIVLNFLTRTSRIITKQKLVPSKRVEDDKDYGVAREEPQRISHVVVKPVIQEIREIITPYRKIVQEVQPMREEVLTIVMKAAKDSSSVNKKTASKQHSSSSSSLSSSPGTKGGSEHREHRKSHKSSSSTSSSTGNIKTSSRNTSGTNVDDDESNKSTIITPESPSSATKRRSKQTKTKQYYF